MLNKSIAALIRFRWLLFLVFAALAFILGPYAQKAFVPDNSIKVWFLEDDPTLLDYEHFQDTFGNDEVLLILLENQNASVFDEGFFQRIDALSQDLESLEGVFQVTSIANVQDAFDTEEGIIFRKASEQLSLDDYQTYAMESDYFKDRLINSNGQKTLVWAQMAAMENFDQARDQVLAHCYDLLAKHGFADAPRGGIGVIYSALNLLTAQDLATVGGLGYLLMFVFLGFSFRTVRYVLATLVIVSLSTSITLGLMGLAGVQVNMVTVVLPTVILVLGIADAIHFPSTFRRLEMEHPQSSKYEIVFKSLQSILVPCLLTSVTTAVGFFALSSAPMSSVRQLGIYAGIGVLLAFLLSGLLMSIFYLGLKKLKSAPDPREHSFLSNVLDKIKSLVKQRPQLISIICIPLFLLSLILSVQQNIDTYTLGYLPSDHSVVQDHETIESRWGYYQPFEFTLRLKSQDFIETADTFNRVAGFQAEVMKQDEIFRSFSILDIYQRLAKVMNIPTKSPWSEEEIAQLKFVLNSQHRVWEPDDDEYLDNILAPVINFDRDLLRITFTSKMLSAQQADQLKNRILKIGQKSFGDDYLLKPAGYPPLYIKIIDYAMESQISSFGLALVLIFLLMIVWLRSLRLALISLIPNLFPVLGMFSLMHLLGIDLDIATATIAAIVMGVAVDDTIHFMFRWREGERLGLDWEQCLDHSFAHAGKAALVTSLILMGSYPVLLLAQVKTVQYFGILTSAAAFLALLADLFMLPCILKFFHKPRPQAQET
ncbi:efflux RND transporter permease subunit [Pseudobacteriovorax antillogorgiicola]|uniref:SSD domain-containing protein n=1 Tax=Pseudobacteriovorax antillogorgiicola TaxID=1513793 RepID=A0A1Y6CRN3_9BACT|nr:MMPL family transporter [Pseudobacteriovorax antillogorgiicola]TCS45428.1 hypothetical protein EDD56_12839 [Pseudobacteriovorax antillogorgiicola]SMF74212.1 hypothetical protein SAMN06296036_12839 [Pseudobacteriovorax antillogorgiicola]